MKKSLSKLALSIFSSYVVPSLQSGGIGPERSGLINPFNVFHQSLGELLFDLSFSTNLSRSALLDFLISFVTKFL